MAATFEFKEDNGASTGSPAHGTTRTAAVTQVNWKAVDDVATDYTTAPVNAGENSYPKFQYGHFSGTFNQISNGLWYHTDGTLDSEVELWGAVTSTYTTPSQSALSGLADISTPDAIEDGLTVLFSDTDPADASPTSTLDAEGYTQYLVTQMRTTGSAPTGDTGTQTLTLRYSEN